ncbi:hypothetical protein LJR219_003715 [Phenylobacterium sp. LjRoot219]|uniref:urease accessory protein UreF n=1 Tax=Phenylobacterium sp. LjRoot219 TaxID=3342283 RepID=UPI003ECDDA13
MATTISAPSRTGDDAAVLLRLMTWFSPAFPVGAFGFSHGLETAIRDRRVDDADSLAGWIAGLLEVGSGWTDAVLFKLAWAASGDELAELAELAAAFAPSLERRRETLQLGTAFLTAVGPWLGETPPPSRRSAPIHLPRVAVEDLGRRCSTALAGELSAKPTEGAVSADLAPYPVVAGWACAAAAIPLAPALAAFLHAFAANLVSVAIRAVPLGHVAGVAVMAKLEPFLAQTAARAATAELDDLGACAILSDIAAMRHETLPGRLFIS